MVIIIIGETAEECSEFTGVLGHTQQQQQQQHSNNAQQRLPRHTFNYSTITAGASWILNRFGTLRDKRAREGSTVYEQRVWNSSGARAQPAG